MKKKAIIFLSMLSVFMVSYSASVEENLKSIESKYDSILKKGEEKKLELRDEKDKLNEEVSNLNGILDRKDEEKSNNIFKYVISIYGKLFSKCRRKLKVNRIKV